MPLVENQAVAVLKRQQPQVSVGQKTYGIKLRSKIVIPALSKWLAVSFIEAKLDAHRSCRQPPKQNCIQRQVEMPSVIEWCQYLVLGSTVK